MVLPCNMFFKPCRFLRMRSLPAVKFRLVLCLQFHPFTVMVALHGLDFILQPLDGFLMRGNLTAQILDFIFQGF